MDCLTGGGDNMNNTAMNICVEVFMWTQKILCGLISFEYIPRSGIMVVLYLTFEEPSPVSLGICTILHFDQ